MKLEEIFKRTIKDNYDLALAGMVAELPILEKNGINLIGSLEEQLVWISTGTLFYSLLNNNNISKENMLRRTRNVFLIFYGVFAGAYDPTSPLANYDGILALECAGASIFSQYYFMKTKTEVHADSFIGGRR